MPGERYSVVWPRAEKGVVAQPLARRLDSLEGKTVAQLWDYLFRGDEIFPMLEQALEQRFPGIRFVRYDTFGSTHSEDERRVLAELPGKLRDLKVDAVLSGMGC